MELPRDTNPPRDVALEHVLLPFCTLSWWVGFPPTQTPNKIRIMLSASIMELVPLEAGPKQLLAEQNNQSRKIILFTMQ